VPSPSMLQLLARHGRLALLALTLVLGAAAPAAAAGPFATDSVWDSQLSDHAAVVADSPALVSELRRQAGLGGGTWINTTSYSVPVYTVGPNQPTVRIHADTPYPPLQAGWDAVPLPANARPSAGSDAHLVVHQPSTDTLWEFWAMYEGSDGWHAHWGGKMEHVSQNPGYFEGTWGGTATSLALMGGLIRPDEMAAGRIDHALALAIPEVKQGSVVWPAQRGDGSATGPNAIPEGTRFRIDPDLDLDSLWLAPAARVIAEAAQKYGMIVRDQAGAVVLYAEDPKSLGADPWPGLFNEWPNNLLNSLPWDHMEVVTADRSAFRVADAAPTPTQPPAPVATPTPPPVTTPVPVPPTPVSPPAVTPPSPSKPARKTATAKTTQSKPSAKARAAAARAARACTKARGKHATKQRRAACSRAKIAAKRVARA
jgi:hypothetical protein